MRRSTLAVLTTVSLAALVSVATASQAVQPPAVVLGVLKPTEDWKVGTVKAGDTSFCAMVTKYESGVGLAFARTPDGYGTVAMNLNQSLFNSGDSYDVQLKAQGAKPRTLKARATSDRSIVVQIGQDKALNDVLKGNGTFELSMPAADISFSLSRFSNSFKSLVSCAGSLDGAGKSASASGPKVASAKVQDVEQDSLAPIDREVQKLSDGAPAPKAAAEGETSLDAQLDAVATGAPGADSQKIALVSDNQKINPPSDNQQSAALSKTDPQQVAQAQDQQPKVERKLLVSAHSDTPAVPPSDTGAMAKRWDNQQEAGASSKLSAAQDKAALQQAVADREAKIAALDADKTTAADRDVAEFNRKQQVLDQQTAALHQQGDKVAAQKPVIAAAQTPAAADEDDSDAAKAGQKSVSNDKSAASPNKAAKAGLVARTAALAKIDAQREEQREELTQKLAASQSGYQAKIAALETERDGLKGRLADTSAKAGKLEQQEAADGRQLASVQTELSSVKAEDAQKLAALQKTLTDRTSALDILQKQGDGRTASLVKEHRALTDQLEEKRTQVAELEQKLAGIKAARAIEDASVKTAKVEIPAERKSLVIVNDDENADPAALKSASGSQNASLQKAQDEVAELRVKNAALSEQVALASAASTASTGSKQALESQHAELEKAQGELADLRAKNAALADQVVKSGQLAAAQPAPDKQALEAQRADLEKAQGELADLRTKNADLSGKLASVQADAQHQLAETETQEHAKLQEAQAEISELRAARAANEQKLADARAAHETDTRAAHETTVAATPSKGPVAALHVFVPDVPAHSLAQTEPAAGDVVAKSPAVVSSVAAETASAAPAPQAAEARSGFDDNRAAAFLDRIMAYHHPAGTPPYASSSNTAALSYHKPVAASTAAQPPVLSSVQPVAHDGAMSAMPEETVATAAAPAAVAAAGTLPLEKLLATSGVDASFKSDPAGASVRQWTTGNLNGMYEQMPAGNFDTLAQSYIGRYRQDCPGKLEVNVAHPQTTAAGTLERANVSCAIPNNSYSTSFVFLQEGGKFDAILHTGYPADAAKVRAIGDNIAAALGSSGGLAGGASAQKADATPAVSHHFTIPASTVAQ